MPSERMQRRIEQKWITYKRDRWLRSCQKNQDEVTYKLRRMTSICNHLRIPASRLDVETMQTITSIIGKEYRASVGKALIFINKKTKTKNYAEFEVEALPEDLRRVVEGAFYYENLTGFLCTLYEWENKPFIKVQYINDISKSLWLVVRIVRCQSDLVDGIYLDYFWSDFDELTKFKGLYFSERNKTVFSYIFCDKYCQDEEAHQDYMRWVTKVELRQLFT